MAQAIHQDVRTRDYDRPYGQPQQKQLYSDDVRPEEIEDDIDHTRAAMDSTISELLGRLAPRNLLGDGLAILRATMTRSRKRPRRRRRDDDYEYEREEYEYEKPGLAKRAAKATGKQAVEIVRNHPIPSALITTGVVWMLMEEDRPTRRARRRAEKFGRELEDEFRTPYRSVEGDYGGETGMRSRGRVGEGGASAGERASQVTERAKHAAGEWAGQARERISHAGENIKERVSGMGHDIRERASNVGESVRERASDVSQSIKHGYQRTHRAYDRAMDEYPLAVGAVALGAGFLAGLLLPRTRAEERYLGEASEKFKERGREIGREMAERGSEVAEHAASEAAEMAGEEAREAMRSHEPSEWSGERSRGQDI